MFDRNPVHWLEFRDNFYHTIHKKLVFNDSLRIEHLMNSLHGEVKKSVKTVESNGYIYTTVLKVLKEISAISWICHI